MEMLLLILGVCAVLAVAAIIYPLRHQPALAASLALVLLLGIGGLYAVLGSPRLEPVLAQHNAKMDASRKQVNTHVARVKADRNNLESWIRLGQAYASLQDWPKASAAFKQAVLLSSGQPDLIMAYARSLIMEQDGKVNDHAHESLKMVLMQKPEHEEARYYMAVRLLQDGRAAEAMAEMKSLYGSLSDDSPVKAMIDAQIGRN